MIGINRLFFLSALSVAGIALSVQGGSFSSDFNSGTPGGSMVYGDTVVDATGGVGDSGVLKITSAVNSQNGSFVIDDLDPGNLVYGFNLTCKVRIAGGSNPADGFSINFAPDLPDGTAGGAEEGVGSGLRFCFDIYDNGGENPPARSIDAKVGGAAFITAHQTVESISTGANFEDVHIEVTADGRLNMAYKGVILFTNVFIPGYQPLAGRFGIFGRTGGANANQWIDDLDITTYTQPMVAIRQQPLAQKVLVGHDATLNVQVTNPDGATFQWYKDGTVLTGANADTLVIPSVVMGSSDGLYKCEVTGPNNTATSDEVQLSVVAVDVPSTPQVFFDFNDFLTPVGTFVTGTAYVNTFGGVGGSGVLVLTDAINSLSGGFVIGDLNAGMPVYGFTARFQSLVGNGTVPPADGFAFAFGADIPDNPTGDFDAGNGLGTGLVVSFDIYNNDGIIGAPGIENPPAPSIDLRYNGAVLASAHLPLSFMETGFPAEYGDTIIRLESDGTADVVYRGVLVLENVYVPGFSSISGGRFALAARTGGLNAAMWFDDIELTTDLTPGALRITQQPADQMVLVGNPATFTVAVNDPTGVTYQWYRGETAIPGEVSDTYTLPATVLGDNGATFKVEATKGITVTSGSVTLTVVDLTAPTAPDVTYDFNDGLVPTGTAVYGSALVSAFGGVGDSGVLQITIAANDQNGAFVAPPVQAGAELSALSVAFDLLIGGGTSPPADGMSFNWSPTVADGTVGGAEDGNGNGLTISFDTWDNGATENPPAPSIDVRYKGAVVGTTKYPVGELQTGTEFVKVLLRVNPDGKLDLAFGDRVLQHDLQLPNYTFTTGGKFGFYARTGGANANQFVDNLQIQGTKSTAPLRVVLEPEDALVIEGKTASFSVGVSDPIGATYQWSKDDVAIPGATDASYTTPAATTGDDGATFSVTASGPGGTATSRKAVLTVVEAITISTPDVLFDFNDGLVPVGTVLNAAAAGGGYINFYGGVGDSGVLVLTDNFNSQGGTFIIDDLKPGEAVSSFTMTCAAMVGGGTSTPADGFSFVWADNLSPTVVFGEGGSGSGLIVSFDIYDNGGGEAPAIEVIYKGTSLMNKNVPLSVLETGFGVFGDVAVRVNGNGTIDVQYNGNAIFNQLPLPGFTPMSGGQFAFGGRTGGLNEYQWLDNIAIETSTAPVSATLVFDTSGGGLTMTWPAGFKLQSTPTLAPPNWQDVAGATSPYPSPMGGDGLFYRLVNQ